LVDF